MSENFVEMKVSYPTGKSGGEIVVKSTRMKGRVFSFPRELCHQLSKEHKDDLQYPCVYVLWDSGALKPKAYVGESDNFLARVERHLGKKDFWNRVAVYTTPELTKTDTLSFEAWLVRFAKQAKRCDLQNTQDPRERKYPSKEEERAAKHHCEDVCRFFLPLAGCDFFNPARLPKVVEAAQKPAKREKADAAVIDGQGVELFLVKTIKGVGVSAQGRDTEAGFVIAKNSTAVKEDSVSVQHSRYQFIADTRRDLVESEILVKNDAKTYRFSQDWNCESAYKAATVILGRPTSGAGDWKDAEGRTLKQLQQR